MLEVFFFAVSRHVRLGVLCRCPAVEIFSFSTLLCFTLGPGPHVTYLIYRIAKRKPDFVRPQPPSRDYWGFPWRAIGPILGDPGAVSRVGRKGGTKVFKYGWKSPWVPTLIKLFTKIQADAGSWLGTKNALYYCAQLANSFCWVLFMSLYTTAIVLPHLPSSFTKLVRARETFIFYFLLTRNEGTTVLPAKKHLGCYQQEQFNLPREYSVFDSSQYYRK